MPARKPAPVTVPCANDYCHNVIDARRAALPVTHGLCEDCNASLLRYSPAARERTPDYETATMERTTHVVDLRAIWRDERGVAA